MDIIYRLEHESSTCEYIDKRIIHDDGSTYMEVDQLITPGLMLDVIRPSDGDDPHAALYLHGEGSISIEDQCDDGQCVTITIKTPKMEISVYLPENISLTSLDAAICSAIMERRAREEGK